MTKLEEDLNNLWGRINASVDSLIVIAKKERRKLAIQGFAREVLLFLLGLFVGLKIGGAVEWSWWVVLSPLLVPIALAVLFGTMAYVLKIINNGRPRGAER